MPENERIASLTLPALGAPLTPVAAQRLAVSVATRGLGRVAPNPLVGSVVVDREHRFVAAGAHEKCGDRHAEVSALDAAERIAPARVRGGTIYVTLEPCAHQGRQPPCAPRVAASGVAHVVYGARDPNPQVDGRGADRIRQAGIACELDEAWRPDCEDLAEVYMHGRSLKRPFVALKAAVSLDGAMARDHDQRAFLTGPRARAYGHYLRVRYDAVVIGRRTLVADDPELTPREALVPRRNPLRIVIDPNARGAIALANPRLLATDPATVVWLTAPGAFEQPAARAAARRLDAVGARRIEVACASGRIKAAGILGVLGDLGVTSLLLEGGAGLYAPFLTEGLVDRLHLFQAPRLLGDGGAIFWNAGTGQLGLHAGGPVRVTALGDDLVLETRLTAKVGHHG